MQKHQERDDQQNASDRVPILHPEKGSSKFRIEDLEVSSNSRVLVLAPHLEDPIVGCSGTICKLAKRGAHVKGLYMTDSSCERSKTLTWYGLDDEEGCSGIPGHTPVL